MSFCEQIATDSDPSVLSSSAAKDAQRSAFAWFVCQFRPQWKWQASGILLAIASSVFTLSDPLVMKWILDTVLPGRNVLMLAVGTGLVVASYVGRSVCANAAS